MTQPTISVVMPNYNHAIYLPQAIEQIVEQSHPPDEFLIFDDASTDQSRLIIKAYAAKYPSIRAIYHPTNVGVNEAHRLLFEQCRGDYVYAGAADDLRYPHFLKRTMELAIQYPQAGLISTQLTVGDESGTELGVVQIRRWQETCYADPQRVLRDYFDRESPSHSLCTATVYRREALREMGWYHPELGSWGDTFSARAVALKYGMGYVPEKLAMWRRMDSNFSAASRVDSEKTLQLVAQAASLMRAPPFSEWFPKAHVSRWEKRYRRLVVYNTWMGEGVGLQWKRFGYWARALKRFPHLIKGLRLLMRNPKSKPKKPAIEDSQASPKNEERNLG